MKYFFVFFIIIFSVFPGSADEQVRLLAGTCVNSDDFREFTSDSGIASFWGIGWEVIHNHLGMGGNYYTNFNQDIYREWSVNWYSEVIFLSYHVFGTTSFFDPFVQGGLGCSGEVHLNDYNYDYEYEPENLRLTIFPYVSAGMVIAHNNFLVGTKLNYTPVTSPIPVTNIEPYFLNETQLHIFAGIYF
ncbi:MAG: hypothetical protein JXJ04_18330 [Spirochaetales bacterium]|nr:hypothetical protein [Spirochaetales bacterium]